MLAPRVGRLKGRVREVMKPGQGSGTGYKVKAIVVNPASALQSGQAVKARVKVVSTPRNPYVPLSCLIREGDAAYLFVIEDRDGDQIARRKQVKLGATTEKWAELRGGVRPTQLVILPPFDMLKTGDKVTIASKTTDPRRDTKGVDNGKEDR